MECSIHFGVEAEKKCVRCGAGICNECDEIAGHTDLCPQCIAELSDELIAKTQSQIRQDKLLICFVEGIFVTLTAIFVTLAFAYSEMLMLTALAPCFIFAVFSYYFVRKNYKKRKNNLKIIKDRLKKCRQLIEYKIPS